MGDTARVACCQFAPTVGDPAGSASQAGKQIREAVAAGAQIVVLPELANSGYVFASTDESQAAATPVDGPVLASWIAAAGAATVIAGFAELAADGTVYNSSALIDDGEVKAVYRKIHLWGDEPDWFAPGSDPAPVIETRHGRIGVAICYDIEFPELTRGLALAGADVIAFSANWPYEEAPPGERAVLHELAATTAYLNRVFVAVSDRCGTERGIEFEGGSVIAAPSHDLLAGPVAGRRPEILVADCDFSQARDKRTSPRNDAFADRRAAYYLAALSTG